MTRCNYVEGQAWARLLGRVWERMAPCGPLGAAPFPLASLSTSRLSGVLAGASSATVYTISPSGARHFSKAAHFFDALTLPSRKGLFNDAVAVSSLLPNRKEFSPQFSPHGIWLVPKTILAPQPPSEKATSPAAAAGAGVATRHAAGAHLNASRTQSTTAATASGAQPLSAAQPAPVMEAADRTKVWRRLKIKKHKIKKRRKEARYKTDK